MSNANEIQRYKQIEHTGDIGIKIFGKTIEDLFINAAFGMFDIMVDLSNVKGSQAETLEVAGDNYEELLVNWLTDLNFVFITENKIFHRFQISRLTHTEMTATAFGEPFDPRRHPIQKEIKAVTFHEIYVKETKNKWEAQVIFDV